MGVELNWIAILLAAASTMVVGSLWYGPLFGKAWIKLAKVKTDPNFGVKQGVPLYGGAFLASALTAMVIAVFAYIASQYFGGSFLQNTLWVGVVLWAGFTAARVYMHDSFEGRRKKLTVLNVAHELVTISIMALIIGLLPA
jgi:hypothetical protein